MDTGQLIKKFRIEKGLTQKGLSSISHVSENAIKQYEGGKRQPKSAYLKKIADALEVSVDELLTGETLSKNEKTYINTETNVTTHDLAYRETMKDVSDSEAYDALIKLQCYAYNRSKNYVGLKGKEYNELLDEVCKTINNHALNVLRDRGELIYSPKKEGE